MADSSDAGRAEPETRAPRGAELARRRVPRYRSLLLHWLGRALRSPRRAAVAPLPAVEPGQVGICFAGHASVLVRYASLDIACDPMLGNWVGAVKRAVRPGLSPADLDRVDLVLISDAQRDHLHVPTLARLPRSATVIVPPQTAQRVSHLGFARLVELGLGQSVQHRGVDITTAAVRHGAGESAHSYVIRGNGPSVYFCGDSGYFSGFKEVGRRFRPDIALLPIGGYSPKSFRARHMTPFDAVRALEDLEARMMIPIRYGAFALSYERLDHPLRWLREVVRARDFEEFVAVLEPGQSRVFRSGAATLLPARAITAAPFATPAAAPRPDDAAAAAEAGDAREAIAAAAALPPGPPIDETGGAVDEECEPAREPAGADQEAAGRAPVEAALEPAAAAPAADDDARPALREDLAGSAPAPAGANQAPASDADDAPASDADDADDADDAPASDANEAPASDEPADDEADDERAAEYVDEPTTLDGPAVAAAEPSLPLAAARPGELLGRPGDAFTRPGDALGRPARAALLIDDSLAAECDAAFDSIAAAAAAAAALPAPAPSPDAAPSPNAAPATGAIPADSVPIDLADSGALAAPEPIPAPLSDGIPRSVPIYLSDSAPAPHPSETSPTDLPEPLPAPPELGPSPGPAGAHRPSSDPTDDPPSATAEKVRTRPDSIVS